MLTTTQPAMAPLNVNGAWCEALLRGCAGRMAQEFGDHPDAAASRMSWVRQLAQTRKADK